MARSGQILRLFAASQRLRVAEVAARLGMQRSTVHRYMTSLAGEGLLERDADGSFRIGPALLRLGMSAVGGMHVVELAGPYMQRLAAEAGETVVLSLWGGQGPVVARVQEDDSRLVHVSVRLGSALPLDSAQGQVFLATPPHDQRAARLLEQLPEHPRLDLERRIASAREHGMAINSRVVEGIRAISVAVLDQDQLACATLALVGTVASIPDTTSSGLAQALRRTAGELSADLGWLPTADHERAPSAAGAAARGD